MMNLLAESQVNHAISTETGLTVGLVVTIVCCTVWLSTKLSKIDSRLSKLEEDHYTKAEAAESSLRLAIENPSINVPDPRNPGKLIRPRVQ